MRRPDSPRTNRTAGPAFPTIATSRCRRADSCDGDCSNAHLKWQSLLLTWRNGRSAQATRRILPIALALAWNRLPPQLRATGTRASASACGWCVGSRFSRSKYYSIRPTQWLELAAAARTSNPKDWGLLVLLLAAKKDAGQWYRFGYDQRLASPSRPAGQPASLAKKWARIETTGNQRRMTNFLPWTLIVSGTWNKSHIALRSWPIAVYMDICLQDTAWRILLPARLKSRTPAQWTCGFE